MQLDVEEDSGKNEMVTRENMEVISPSNNYSNTKMENQHEDHEALLVNSNNSSHLVNNSNPSTKSQSNNITPSPTPTKLDTTTNTSSTVTERKSNGVITSKDSQKESNDNSKKDNSVETDGYLARTDNLQGLEDPAPPPKIVWRNVIIFAYVHIAVLYSVYLILSGNVMWQTLAFACWLHFLGGMGITAGAHRCWSHKAYKAKTPLKVILAFMQTLAFQNSVWEWVRDHRVHHKYAETNADPHNAKRGFFFAHIGWLLCRKHDLVRVKGKTIDLSDIESDPVIMFQKKYHLPLGLIICFVLPTILPWKLWGESALTAFLVAAISRYAFTLHITWLVNSAAHMWGPKPYDKSINPSENKSVALFAFGEGWHNYHHVFPWDYKTAELGQYRYNLTTAFVDFFAAIGWAYDLKTVPKNIVMQRIKRTGDGTWSHHDHHHETSGVTHWGDKNIPTEDAKVTQTLYANGTTTKND